MQPSHSRADRVAISLRDLTDVWGDRNPAAIDAVYHPEYRGHGFPLGTVTRSEYRMLVTAFQTAFPDASIALDGIDVDDSFVYLEWTFRGTHSKPLFGLPSSGAEVRFSGTGRHRHRDGRVAEVEMDVSWWRLYAQVARGYLSRR